MPSKDSAIGHLKKESFKAWFEQEVKKQLLWLTLTFASIYSMSYLLFTVSTSVIVDLQMFAPKRK